MTTTRNATLLTLTMALITVAAGSTNFSDATFTSTTSSEPSARARVRMRDSTLVCGDIRPLMTAIEGTGMTDYAPKDPADRRQRSVTI